MNIINDYKKCIKTIINDKICLNLLIVIFSIGEYIEKDYYYKLTIILAIMYTVVNIGVLIIYNMKLKQLNKIRD